MKEMKSVLIFVILMGTMLNRRGKTFDNRFTYAASSVLWMKEKGFIL